MSKKILITYATAGIGHKKAALAVNMALENKKSEFEIKLIDILDYTPSFFKKSYPAVYLFLVNKLIFLWGIFYYLLDNKIAHFLLYPIRKIMHVLNTKAFIKFLLDFKPDMVVSTHFLTADVCEYVKRKYRRGMKVVNVITDYRAHSFWVSGGVDFYVVAANKTRLDLIKKWGISQHRIEVLGIPVEPKFSVGHDRGFFRKKFEIPDNSFSILLLGGGYGVGPILEILKALDKKNITCSALVVCGHNAALKSKVDGFKKKTHLNILNYGYVNNINELMAASDLYIGKAGGVSITEALAQELPLALIRPIPGQEARNAKFMLEKGVALEVKKIEDISEIVKKLDSSEEKLRFFKENIRNVRKINAAYDIAGFIINKLK